MHCQRHAFASSLRYVVFQTESPICAHVKRVGRPIRLQTVVHASEMPYSSKSPNSAWRLGDAWQQMLRCEAGKAKQKSSASLDAFPLDAISMEQSGETQKKKEKNRQGVRIKQRAVDFSGKSWPEILELSSSDLNSVSDIVAAWFQLGKSVRGAKFSRALISEIPSNQHFKPLRQKLLRVVKQLQPRQLSNAWLGTRDLRLTGDEELLHQLSQATLQIADSFDAQSTTNTLNALANLGHHPGEQFMSDFATAVITHSVAMNAQEVANTLNAFAKLGHHPGEVMMTSLCTAVARTAGTMNRQGVANTLNAFAKLGYPPGEGLMLKLCTAVGQNSAAMNAQEVANTVHAFAKLGHKPGEVIMTSLCTAVARTAGSMNAQEVANTLNAFAKLGHHPGEGLILILCSAAAHNSVAMNAQEVSNTLNAFAKLDHDPGKAIMTSLWAAVARTARSMNTQEVVNSLNSFARLGLSIGEYLMTNLCSTVAQNAAAMEPQEVSNMLNAFAKLAYRPDERLMSSLCTAVAHTAGSMNVQDVANTLHAFCVMGHVNVETFISLYKVLGSLSPGQVEADQIYSVQMCLELEYHEMLPLLPALPTALQTSVLQSRLSFDKNTTESRLQQSVSHVLEGSLGIPHVKEDYKSTGLSVDILIDQETVRALRGRHQHRQQGRASLPVRPIAVEVDGPSHFLRSLNPEAPTWVYNGYTLFKQRLLRARGLAPVTVPFYEWYSLQNDRTAQEKYLLDCLLET